MSQPTLHITNWSSRKLHGPGRMLTIMAQPRHWERGAGRVTQLVPGWFASFKRGDIDFEEYRRRYAQSVKYASVAGHLHPGALFIAVPDPRITSSWNYGGAVQDADTLCCGCSREAARFDRCHRVWAAHALICSGWRVILDGTALEVRCP